MSKQLFVFCNLCCHTCERTLPLSEYDVDKRLFKPKPYKDCKDCKAKQKQERRQKYYKENKYIIYKRRKDSENRKVYEKMYYQEHKEQHNETHECGCGGSFSNNRQLEHFNTTKHIKWMNH
jgi:hypothetical protein